MKKNSMNLIFVLIILMGLFLFYNVQALQEDAREFVEMDLINEASRLSADFDAWIGSEILMLEAVRDVIKHIPMEELKYTERNNHFLSVRHNEMDPYIGFSDGTVLDGQNRLPKEDFDPRERIWYQNAVDKNSTSVTEVYLGIEYGRPMVTISTPFYNGEDLVGVIAVDILVSDILAGFEEAIIVPESYAFVMNDDGRVLIHSKDGARIGCHISDVENVQSINDLNKMNFDDTETVFYDFEGTSVMAVIRHMNSVDWSVVVAIDQLYINDVSGLFSRETTIINFLFFIVMLYVVRNLYNLEKVVFSTNELLKEKVYELHKAYEHIDKINAQLEKKSNHDALTGVANRGYFDQELDALWHRGLDEAQQLAMIVIDVDYFKNYNDTYGHAMGDQVLIDICILIESLLDESDFFARIGGEEFAVLGYNRTQEDYMRLAEGLRQSVLDMCIPHKESLYEYVTISVGVHVIKPNSSVSIGDFYHQTDEAMYLSKQSGRNKVSLFE